MIDNDRMAIYTHPWQLARKQVTVTHADEELLYTAGEAAKYLGVSRQRIYELAEAERLGKRIVGGWIFRQSELDAYKLERDAKKHDRPVESDRGVREGPQN